MRICFVITIMLSLQHAWGGNIQGSFQDGKPLPPNGVLLLNDTCIFKVMGTEGNEGYKWSFRLEKKDGSSYELKKTDDSPAFIISADSALYRNFYLYRDLKQTIVANDSSVYFTGKIFCQSAENQTDSFPVRLNLLPSMPRILEVKLIYNGYDTIIHDFKDAALCLTYSAARATQMYLEYTTYLPDNKYFFEFIEDGGKLNPWESIHNFCTPGFYYEEYYTLFVRNNCGQSVSQDTILTTDYINDPEILKDLQEYWHTNSIKMNKIAENELQIYYDPISENMYLKGDLSSIRELKIFDTNGKCRKIINKAEPVINLSSIEKGIYIITGVTGTSKIFAKKFIKQ